MKTQKSQHKKKKYCCCRITNTLIYNISLKKLICCYSKVDKDAIVNTSGPQLLKYMQMYACAPKNMFPLQYDLIMKTCIMSEICNACKIFIQTHSKWQKNIRTNKPRCILILLQKPQQVGCCTYKHTYKVTHVTTVQVCLESNEM